VVILNHLFRSLMISQTAWWSNDLDIRLAGLISSSATFERETSTSLVARDEISTLYYCIWLIDYNNRMLLKTTRDTIGD